MRHLPFHSGETPNPAQSPASASFAGTLRLRSIAIALLHVLLAAAISLAQQSGKMSHAFGVRALPDHVPAWANAENSLGAVPAGQRIPALTLVLARSPERQAAFEKLLADQQDPNSPEYHRWLTPEQIGERFGLASGDIDSITSWLESKNLHVDWVSPARNFIGFSGAAGDVNRAFQTELNYYQVKESRKISIASPPMLPADLAPHIRAIHGLYSLNRRPASHTRTGSSASPAVTYNGSDNYLTPSDFAAIYDVPSALNGSGVSIGIVGRSRTNPADFANFRTLTGATFADPTEIVPTAYGGVDPGPAYTAPPTGGQSIDDQLEATLDVFRAASIAQSAKVLLMVNKSNQDGGSDIGGDMQYLVNTKPLVQVVNISFCSCEVEGGSSDVSYWDGLFSQAAGEGISIFVASGDAGASGCDTFFATPPANPEPNSPNAICSSTYATCLGGTEFADSDETKYWNTNASQPNSPSALGYIPEGAWNEPSNGNGGTQAASSGGGVSQYVATPPWQTGTGVPSERAGRYTPDISFSASGHDGYWGCLAAIAISGTSDNAGCAIVGGYYYFAYFYGTSAAAPDMAGVTALLDQKLGGKGQGDLNPRLYSMYAKTPSVFHDVTVATSGVSSCSVNTPSMCNNSIPSPTGLSGGQAGYLVNAGFDEVTGLGSLDVSKFIAAYQVSTGKAPVVETLGPSAIAAKSVTVSGEVNAEGQATQYWFQYGTSSTFAGAAKTAAKSAGSGSALVTYSAPLTSLEPGTMYYYRIVASNAAGTSNGDIDSFTTPKGTQTITFIQPPTPVRYGKKVALIATSSSGLAVTFSVKGPAKISGSTLTVTGLGAIVIAATQAGNSHYLPAARVERTITGTKGILTVTANNLTMTEGGKLPTLTYTITGYANGDTSKVVSGKPVLSTAVTSATPPGSYGITVKVGTLTAVNYAFSPKPGTLTVKKAQ